MIKNGLYRSLTFSLFQCRQCGTTRTYGLNIRKKQDREHMNREPLILCQGTCKTHTVHKYIGPGPRPRYELKLLNAKTQLLPLDA